jgi:hypothetical protein
VMVRISPDFSRPLLHTFRCTFQVGPSLKTHREYGVLAALGTAEAVANAIEVGLGTILNDAVAGVARRDFDTHHEFVTFAMRKITTRLDNLKNADRRSGQSAAVKAAVDQFEKLGGGLTEAEIAAVLAARSAPKSDESDPAVDELKSMNDAA